MFPQSIRSRIIFWFVLVMALIWTVFCVFVYSNLRNNLYEQTNDLLELKAEGVFDYINAYWKVEKRRGIERGEDVSAFVKVNSANFVQIAEHWVNEIPLDARLQDIAVGIFDSRGRLIAASKHSLIKEHLTAATLEAILKGKSSFLTLRTSGPSGKMLMIRTLTLPILENHNLVGVVQVAKPLTFVLTALQQLRDSLLFFFFPALLLAGLTGFWLAKPILYPLDHILDTVRKITAENLRLRVQVPVTQDEIQKLAEMFNEMLDKLEKSFSAQKQIIQDISHELRTPLTILKGEMELALKRLRSTKEYEDTLRSNLEEIDRIVRMVENLLTLARFDAQEMKLPRQSLRLDHLLEQIIEDLRILVEQKKLMVNVFLKPEVTVQGDTTYLRQVFLNILENAIKYTPEGGKITVRLDGDNTFVKVAVTDTGIGIAPEHVTHIFDRFYRADSSRSSQGFGLGLSLAKSIVDAHRGKISVTSRLNQGTTFLVTLSAVSVN